MLQLHNPPRHHCCQIPRLLIRRWHLLFWAFVAFPPRSRSHKRFSSPNDCASAPSSASSPTTSALGPAGRLSASALILIDLPSLPRL
ncbi:unnamed protein product [Closterium sp. NIES-54]